MIHDKRKMVPYIAESLRQAMHFGDVEMRRTIAIALAKKCEAHNFTLEDLLIYMVERIDTNPFDGYDYQIGNLHKMLGKSE
jgi:hypothetical protein